VQDFM